MKNDTTVRCDSCGATKALSFSYGLRTGWPMCHGQTMRLLTRPSAEKIRRDVGEIASDAKADAKNEPRHD